MNLIRHPLAAIRRRLADESGFTMIVALGVLMVTSLLVTATFVALTNDTHLTQSDLDAKRAYYAARAGAAQKNAGSATRHSAHSRRSIGLPQARLSSRSAACTAGREATRSM